MMSFRMSERGKHHDNTINGKFFSKRKIKELLSVSHPSENEKKETIPQETRRPHVVQ